MAQRSSLKATKPQVKGRLMQRAGCRALRDVPAYLGRADSSSSLLRTPSFT
jgi:hypothetical protein